MKAVSVRFDDERFWIDLEDGRTLGVPYAWSAKLASAQPADRKAVDLSDLGLHWPRLDEDLSIAGLLEGRPAARVFGPEDGGFDCAARLASGRAFTISELADSLPAGGRGSADREREAARLLQRWRRLAYVVYRRSGDGDPVDWLPTPLGRVLGRTALKAPGPAR